MDIRVTVDPIFAAFAVPVTVTRPGEAPIETEGVWVPSISGAGFSLPDIDDHRVEITRAVRRRVMALRVDAIEAAPVGTLIVAPEALGETAQTWLVDELGYIENDLIRVLVRPMVDDTHLANWGKR